MAKKKLSIKIKPENKGKFTEYCKRKGYKGVTKKCIEEGCKSKNPVTKKMACFAKNFAKKKK